VVCSDPAEHRRRVESRLPDIPGHVLPIWDDVMQQHFEPWTGDHLILDTATISAGDSAERAHWYTESLLTISGK
jgi:hypothetical protein